MYNKQILLDINWLESMAHNILTHPSQVFVNELNYICNPLEKLGVSYFCHVNINEKKQFSAICNHPDFALHYIKKKLYNADIHMDQQVSATHKFIIWDSIDCRGKSLELYREAAQFGVRHVFTIIDKKNEGGDYYHFASDDLSPAINHVYFEKINLFNLFILYFKEMMQGSKILKKSYDLKFSLDDNPNVVCQNYEKLPQFSLDDKETLFFQALLKNYNDKYKLPIPINPQSFTKREKQCLSLTMNGHTAQQVADILFLSRRTVEDHLTNIKYKFGVKSKSQLMKLILKNVDISI